MGKSIVHIYVGKYTNILCGYKNPKSYIHPDRQCVSSMQSLVYDFRIRKSIEYLCPECRKHTDYPLLLLDAV